MAALADAVKWTPSVVLVAGEAGVGKTRVIAELASAPPWGHEVVVRRCQPSPDPFPLGVIMDLLSSCRIPPGALPPVVGVLRPYLPEIADRLPPAPSGGPATGRDRVLEAAQSLLRVLGRAVLVLEDVDCADEDTLSLLRLVAADPPPQLSIVLTYRPEDLSARHQLALRDIRSHAVLALALPALDVTGVRTLAGGVSAAAAEVLWERTAGLPFLIEQVVTALDDPAVLAGADRRAAERALDDTPVPGFVRDAVAERVRALPSSTRALVDAAAVIGRPASAGLLHTVAGDTANAADLASLVARAILVEVEPDRYDHRHPLARRVVYEALSAPDRSRLHLRALHALSRRTAAPAIQLARHAQRARSIRDWLRYGERAADLAMDAGEQELAIGQLRDLLAEPDLPAAALARLVTAFCRCALNGTRDEDAVAVLGKLRWDPRLTEETRAEADVGFALLMIRTPGDLTTGGAAITAMLNRSGAGNDRRLRGIALLAMPYLGTRTIEECRRWQDVICRRIGGMPPGTARTTLLASTLQSRLEIGAPGVEDMIRLLPGKIDPDEHEHIRQLARAHCNLADTYAWTGHYQRAREFLRTGLAHAGAAAAHYVRDTGQATCVRLDWLAGHWTGLDDRARALVDSNPHALPVVSEMRLIQGWLALAHADWDHAEQCFLATRLSQPDCAVAPVVIAATGGLIALRLERDDLAGACALAERGVTLLRGKGVWSWAGDFVPHAVRAFLAAGRIGDARALIDQLSAALTTLDAPYPAAALAASRAYLEPTRSAFETVAQRHQQLGLPYHAALLAEQAALCPPTNTDSLHCLARTYEELGAAMAAARCRHLARLAGAALPSVRGRRGYGTQLSPREAEIVHLLSLGRTNREIAETLFVSRRTVEQHLTNIFRKLGTTRHELLDSGSAHLQSHTS